MRLADPGKGLDSRSTRREVRIDEWSGRIEGAADRKAAASASRDNRQSRTRTYLVFDDQATANSILGDIDATPPIEGDHHAVLVGPPVQGAVASDGRVMIAYGWQEAARDWLEAVLEGVAGVQILDASPDDWVPAASDEP